MSNIFFQRIHSCEKELINLISQWYFSEWNIPVETTIQKLTNFPDLDIPFQIILRSDNIPVATGGIYHDVGLLHAEPRFKKYGPWVALIYTIPDERGKGYGAALCEKIESDAKEMGLNKIYLFTFTAEDLYLRLNWKPLERILYKGKDTVVMEKELN